MRERSHRLFQAVIRIANYVKNSPLRGRYFVHFCDDVEEEHTALLYCCEILWLSRAKVPRRIFELKEEVAPFLSDINNGDDAVFK